MFNARVAALAAGILLTLGTVGQAEQADFCVITVDQAGGTLGVAPATEDDLRGMQHVGDLGSPTTTVKLAPKTNYVHARTHPNTGEHLEFYYTQEEFLNEIKPGDVIEVTGSASGPDIIWLMRWPTYPLR